MARTILIRCIAFTALVAAIAGMASAQGEPALSVGGNLESAGYLGIDGSAGDWSSSYGSSSSLSLYLDLRGSGTGTRASAGASLETAVRTGAAAGNLWLLARSGLAPQDEFLVPDPAGAGTVPEVLASIRLRTAWARLDWGWASFTAGSQILNYGRGAVWSPVDIFSSLETRGLSTTRRGVDALRLKAPLGATGLLDLVAAPGRDPDAGTYSIRTSGLLAPGLDAGAVAAWSGDDRSFLAGADFKLDLGASFHGEALWTHPAVSGLAGNDDRLRASCGLDWSAGDFIFLAEYYWNGGVPAAEDPFLTGAHSLYAALSWQASDLLALNGSVTWDITDASGSSQLVASWDAAQGASLAAYLKAGYGAGSSPWYANAGLALRVSF